MSKMKFWLPIMILYNSVILSGQEKLGYSFASPLLDESDMAQNLEEAFTFTKYPNHFQYQEMMAVMARDYPSICKLDTIGFSRQGRPIVILKISDNVNQSEGEAKFLYTSSIHGDELVGYVLLLRLSKYLLENYNTDSEIQKLVDSLEIWINPLSNPDGSFYPDNDSSITRAIRQNSRGKDLNRNYPDPYRSDENDTTGREQETKEMMNFMMKNRFTLSANIHGGEEVVNYPWDYKDSIYHPDNDWYYLISREYADEAKVVDPSYMSRFTDGITVGWEWYVINGGRQDYVNYYLNGREVTLELSIPFTPESESLNSYWETNERSFINYMSQALYGIRGNVSGALSGTPVKANIFIPEHDDAQSSISTEESTGNFYRLIKEGSYDLVISAEGYINDTTFNVNVQDYQSTWLHILLDSIAEPSGFKKDVNASGMKIALYPNPAKEFLNIESESFSDYPVRINIYSLDGKKILSNTIFPSESVIEIDIAIFKRGFYVLRIETADLVSTHKFIKQ
jgi:hypothetical protein